MFQSTLDKYQGIERCADCGRTFEKLRVHHGMTDCGPDSFKTEHECNNCDAVFERYDSHKSEKMYCSDACRNEGIKTGTEKKCEHCGDVFYKPQCHEGRFCSQECSIQWRRDGDEWAEFIRPKVSHTEEVECDWCGTVIERRPSEIREHVYCSDECIANGLSKMKLGEKNPQFKHGYRRNPVSWVRNVLSDGGWPERSQEIRETVECCQICGEDVDRLEVHHIIPVVGGGTNEDYNLLPLCPSCHNRAEGVANTYSDPILLEPALDD
jgi:hypothetical protein